MRLIRLAAYGDPHAGHETLVTEDVDAAIVQAQAWMNQGYRGVVERSGDVGGYLGTAEDLRKMPDADVTFIRPLAGG